MAFKREEDVKISTREKLGATLAVIKEKLKSPLSTPNPSHVNLPVTNIGKDPEATTGKPFALRDVNLEIPRGKFE